MESHLLFSSPSPLPSYPLPATSSGSQITPRGATSLPFPRQARPKVEALRASKAMAGVSQAETESKGGKNKEAKLWGGRFEESVTDIVEKFTESISFDKELYKHDIMGSKAHASMLAQQGLMGVSDRDSIIQGLDEIQRRIEAGEFEWRTDREDVHMNIEAALTDMIGEPAKKLHTARSRNDQVLTDFRLWCRDAIEFQTFNKECHMMIIGCGQQSV